MDIELVTDPYACVMYIVSPLAGLGGDILWRPPVYSLFSSSSIRTPFLWDFAFSFLKGHQQSRTC